MRRRVTLGRRALAVFLAFAMTANSVPAPAIAQALGDAVPQEQPAETQAQTQAQAAADQATAQPADQQPADQQPADQQGVGQQPADPQADAEARAVEAKAAEAKAAEEQAAAEQAAAEKAEAEKRAAEEKAAAEQAAAEKAAHPLDSAPEGVDPALADGLDFSSARLLVLGLRAGDFTPDTQVLGDYDGLFLTQYADAARARNAYLHYRYVSKAELVEPDVAVSAAEEANEAPAESVAARPMDERSNPLAELAGAKAAGEVAAAADAASHDYTVALVDTGYSGEGLVSATSVLGDETADDNGHGTRMAGFIREQHPGARILSVKALDSTGTGTTASVYAAIRYAVEAKADAIDLSLSAWATEENAVVREAIDEATAAGVVVVGAAGNRGVDARRTVPGGVESALVAGAADGTGARLPTSNWGDTVDAYVTAGSTSEAAARMAGWLSANGLRAADWQARLAEAIKAGTFSDGTAHEVAGPELPAEPAQGSDDPNFHAADFPVDYNTLPEGRYAIRSNYSRTGYALSAATTTSFTNGTNICLRPYLSGNGHLEQRWVLRQYPVGSGYGSGDNRGQDRYYVFCLPGTTFIMDVDGGLGNIGSHWNVQLWNNYGGDHVGQTEAWYIWNSGVKVNVDGAFNSTAYRIYVAGRWAGNGSAGFAVKQANNSNSDGTNVEVIENKDSVGDAGLYWTFTKCNYTVKYAKNDDSESGNMDNQTIQLDSRTKLSANGFTKTGYTFKGWATSKSSSTVKRTDQAYANGSDYTDNLGVENGTVTLYPVWEKTNYYLDLNGTLDGNAINNVSGYATADVTVNGVSQKTGVSDYYAQHPYESTFKFVVTANEGRSVTGATVENAKSHKVTTKAATSSAASSVTIEGTMKDSQVIVRPQVTKNKYKVQFNGNGGTSGSMNDQEFTYDTAANLTANSYSRTGYKFLGWSTSSSATSATYTDGQSVSKLASKYINNQTVKLYAVWSANYYTMTLDAQNNAGESDGTTAICERYGTAIYRKKTTSGSNTSYSEPMTGSANAITKPMRNWKVSYQSATNDGQAMSLSTSTANTTAAATFNGYYSAKTDGTQYITSSGNINTTNFKNNTFSQNTTFYAQWSAGGTVTLPTPTMNHYTFDGWYKGVGGTGEKVGDAGDTYQPSGDIILYAKWNKTYFNVRFDANGGSGSFSKSMAWHEDAAITGQTAPSRSGYVFQGFFDAKTGGNKIYNADLSYALTDPTTFHGEAATTYYAHWSPATYYVQFMGWDDDLQDDVVVEVLDATGNPTPADPDHNVPAGCQPQTFGSYTLPGAEELGLSRRHYTFVGWNIYPSQDWRMYDANKSYKGGLAQKQNDVVVLYAAWEPMDQYTISYDANGGSGKPATEEAYKGEDYEIPDAPGIKYANKKFLGWNTSVDGTGDWYIHGASPVTINRGTGPTADNYGYFTTANGEDPGFVSEETQSITLRNAIPGDNVTHNIVLYAMWADWPKLSYNMNDGIGYIAPEYHEPFSTAELDFMQTHIPTRTGYDFVGWAERTGGDGTAESPYAYGTAYTANGINKIENFASDMTLYAQWEKQHMDVDATTTVDDVYAYMWNPGDKVEDGTRGAKIEDATWVPYGDPYWFAIGVTKYYDGSNMTVTVNGTTVRAQGTKEIADDPATTDVDEACTYYLYKVSTPIERQSIEASGIDELTYRVVLMPQGGTIDEDHDVTSYRYAREGNNLPTAEHVTRPGYEFAGWFTNEECTEPEQALTAVPVSTKGDVAYYAKWEPLSFKVRYHSSAAHTFGADAGVSADKLTYVSNDAYSYTESKRLTTVQSTDMFGSSTSIGSGPGNFVGWATSEEDRDNGVVTFTNEQRISGIVPSKAQAVYKYDVTKSEDGGAVTYELTTNDQWPGDANEGYDYSSVTDANSEHYFTTEGATVTVDGVAATGITANQLATPKDQGYYLDLYAIWVPEYVWVHYDVNGGESSPSSARRLKGDTIALPEQGEGEGQVAREGYTLAGWNMTSTGVGPYAGDPTNENKPYTGNYVLTGDVWFQAQWTVGTYAVKFHRTGNDGQDPATPATRTYEMDQTYELPLATGTAEGRESLNFTPPKYDLPTGTWEKSSDYPESAASTRNVGDKVGITTIASDTTDETEKQHLNADPTKTSHKAYQITEGETIYKYNLTSSVDETGQTTYSIALNPAWPGDNEPGCTVSDVSDTQSPMYFTKDGESVKDNAGNVYAQEGTITDSGNKMAVQHKIYQYKVTSATATTIYTLTQNSDWSGATAEAGYAIADVTDTGDTHYFTAGEGIVVKDAGGSPSDATKNRVATKTTTDTVYKYSFTKAENSDAYTLTLNEGWSAASAEGSGYTVADVAGTDSEHYYPTEGDGVSIIVGGTAVESGQMGSYKNQVATKETTSTIYQYEVAKSTSTTHTLVPNPNWPGEGEAGRYFIEDVTDASDPGYVGAGSSATIGDQTQTVNANKVAYPADIIYEWNLRPDQGDMVFVGWATSVEKAGAGEAAFKNVALTDAFKVTNLTKTIGGEVNLYAVWAERMHHYVVYDSNAGTWGTGGQTVASLIDEDTFKTELTDAIPTRVGYTFDKWATRTGEGTAVSPYAYTPATSETTFSTGTGDAQAAVDSTVYARWTPITYRVVFNGDAYEADGSLVSNPVSAAPQEMRYDESKPLTAYASLGVGFKSAAHAKSLKGWTTEKPTAPLAPGASDARSIAYQDGQEVINLTALAYDETVKTRTETVLDAEGNQQEVQVEYHDGEVNLYPVYEYDYVTVAYDSNGGTSLSAVTKLKGEKVKLPKPTRDGYTLMAWIEGREQGEATELPSEGVAGVAGADYELKSDVTLHAWWKKAVTGHALYKWMEGDEQKAQYLLDLNAYVVDEDDFVVAFDPGVTVRAGYTFEGWVKANDTSASPRVYKDSDTEESLALKFQPQAPAKDITFLAQWQPITYKVTYDLNSADAAITKGAIPTNDVTYDHTDETGSKSTELWNPVKDATNAASAPANKHFAGWATQATSTVPDFAVGEDDRVALTSNLSAAQDARVTLYAVWAADTGTLEFDTKDGTAIKNDPITVTTGQAWPDLASGYKPTRKGHVFLGYYDGEGEGATQVYDADLTCQMPDAIEVAQGQAKTLYARWALATYTVVYRGLDGSELARSTPAVDTTFQLKSNTDDDINISIAQGTQKFQWVVGALANKGAPAFVLQPGATITDGLWNHSTVPPKRGDVIELFADVLDLQQFGITYDANGGYYVGGAVPSVKSVTEGDPHTVQFAKVPELKGYRFVGWSLARNVDGMDQYSKFFTESEYDGHADDVDRVEKNPGDDYSVSFIPTGNSTLYAIWEEAKYGITYHGNGGTTNGQEPGADNQTVSLSDIPYTAEHPLAAANAFTRKGYTFLGWGVDASTKRYNAGEKVSGLAEDGQTKDLYAIWAVAEPEDKTLYLAEVPDQTFTGSVIEPRPTVRLTNASGDILVLNRDYLLSYDNNVNVTPDGATDAQKATVTATGIGTYAGFSGSARFTIKPAPEKVFSIAEIADQDYTGGEVDPRPEVTVDEGGVAKTLSFGTDYLLSYDNNVNPSTETSKAKVFVTGIGAYAGYSGTRQFTIKPAPHKVFSLEPVAPQIHTGIAIEPRPTVKVTVGDEERVLGYNRDYLLSYENNVDVSTEGKTATVYAVGINDYAGYSGSATFKITEAPSTALTVVSPADQTYTGAEIKPQPKVTDAAGTELVYGTHYMLVYDNNVEVSTESKKATVYAVGINDYQGHNGSAQFSIKPAPEKTFSVGAVGDQVYTGTPISPQPEVKVGEATLSFGRDYFLTYDSNVNVGTATIYVTGTGAYNGYSGTATFQITAAPKKEFLTGAVGAQRFTGSEIEPKPEVRDGNTVLKLNRDYVLAYENNVDAGEGALIYVTGIGGYSGYSATVNFAIEKVDANDETMSVTAPPDQPYTGSELTPKPTVSFDGKALVEGTDYELAYRDNVNAGTATITVTGKGNFAGERSVTFAVTKRDVAPDTAIVAPVAQVYTGSALTPRPTVTFDGAPLAEGTDYALEYRGNVNAGTATVTVAGTGNFTGSAAVTFQINPFDADSAAAVTRPVKVAPVADQTHTGRAITPKPEVTWGGTTLREGVDFDYSYENNVSVGTATVTVALKGNYKGSKSVTFKINPAGADPGSAQAGSFQVDAVPDQTYTGKAITPRPTVRFAEMVLTEGVDYALSWENNVGVGTATVTVNFKGSYSGSKSVEFRIGDVVEMYRLYNPYSGEHFYTASVLERDTLTAAGWNYEGIGWYAPKKSSTPVYRVFNPYSGDHHYTTGAGERDALVAAGWNDEGIGWYSDDAKGVTLYRQYNPYAATGSHNYTTSTGERDMLVSVGWQDEGIGWYGVKMG